MPRMLLRGPLGFSGCPVQARLGRDFDATMRPAGHPRTTSSSRAGVPRNRTHKSGYSSTGNEKSNFRSNQFATCAIGIPK